MKRNNPLDLTVKEWDRISGALLRSRQHYLSAIKDYPRERERLEKLAEEFIELAKKTAGFASDILNKKPTIVDKVLSLHHKKETGSCNYCDEPYPCATVRVLQEEEGSN